MCIVCVEITRGKVTVKEAMDQMNEIIRHSQTQEQRDHAAELLGAYASNDDKEVNKLVKAGYKKERWI